MDDGARSVSDRLTELRNGLLELHKKLLDSERATYEKDVRKIKSNGELFALVLNDPWFAWLRKLSGLVADIDHRLASEDPVSGSDAERIIRYTRELLTPAEDGQGFERSYFEAMQRDPDVILAHSDFLRVLTRVG